MRGDPAERWIVLYIPSSRMLTINSSYQKHEESGMWDTPEHALLILELALKGNQVGCCRLKAPGLNALG